MKRLRSAAASQPARVFLIGMTGLLVGTVLSAASLLQGAERKPFGGKRDFWVSLWEPFERVSEWTGLDQPGEWIEDVRTTDPPVLPTVQLPPTPTPSPTATSTPSAPTATQPPGVTPTATPTATATPTPVPLLRTPTLDEPLRLWAGGDSQAGTVSSSLARIATETGYFDTTTDFRFSSGLTRPDFFDWPAHLYQEAADLDLEVVVFMTGANDSQPIQIESGEIFQRLTDEWREVYRERVTAMMDLLYRQGRVVVWVGQPIMRDTGFSERMEDLNAIYVSEAEARPWIFFIDTYSMFEDESGGYSAYLPNADGELTLVRHSDGIHLTAAGGDIVARAVLDVLSAETGLSFEE